ncbi:MAG: ATP synthase subunit b, sodium ion specific [bacterium ADurb.Bin157]|nr:MAG: ATP synthase subunit b, sodium ion specific [bacterium ADurb.Bin157]
MNKVISYISRSIFVLMLFFTLHINALSADSLPGSAALDSSAVIAESFSNEEETHEPGLFEIDLWILVSQSINFLVLLLVLQKFLFSPIGKIVNTRRDAILALKAKTESDAKSAEDLKEKYEQRIAKIEDEAYLIRQRAIFEANEKCELILNEARAKAEQIVEEGEMEVFMERQTAWAQIREEVIQLTINATEKVVQESLDDELHRKIIALSIERLAQELPDYKE